MISVVTAGILAGQAAAFCILVMVVGPGAAAPVSLGLESINPALRQGGT